MLKTVLDTLEGVDDAVKPFYVEADGKFVLQVEGVDHHPDVANLKSAYERVKADKQTVSEERDALKKKVSNLPDDFDSEKWEKLKDGKPDEAALVKLRQDMEKEIEEWKGKYTGLSESTRKTAIDRDLTDALNEAGVNNPTFVKAARTLLADQVKVSDEGRAFVDTDMGPLDVADHVKRWAAADGKDFVTPATGGGAKGSDGTKYRDQKPEEMTAQDRASLLKDNPEKFYELFPQAKMR